MFRKPVERHLQPRPNGPRIIVAGFLVLFVGGLSGATCGGTSPRKTEGGGDDGGGKPAEKVRRGEFHLFAFGRVLGTIAPCGCTTEPLGGLQYAFGWLEAQADPKAALVVEPGSFLFPDPAGPDWPQDDAAWDQARWRADILHQRFAAVPTLVSGVGPTDYASPDGASAIAEHALPRVLANAPAASEGEPAFDGHRIVVLESEGITWKVGVTSVIDPSLDMKPLGALEPAAPALRKELEAMRAAGAEFTVALAHGDRSFAETLANEVDGLDAVVVGMVEGIDRTRLGTPVAHVAGTFILEPGEQLQTVAHLTLSLDASGKVVPAVDTWKIQPPRAALKEELARVEERIAKFEADPQADKGFVARLHEERESLKTRIEAEPEGPAVAVFEQAKITCHLPVDDAAKQKLAGYDAAVAEANKKRFAGIKAPPPKPGQAGYVGVEECANCHDEAVEFWHTTVHARAYDTLVRDNKQYDLSCVGCHVTGFRQPGGSEVVENEGLVDVQCEVCHGPGSLHVEDGGDDLRLIRRSTTPELCASSCHTPEHSDTFDYVPYLRDVLGPGHGEEARKKLGDGPTGRELRAAGLAKAGGACKKM